MKERKQIMREREIKSEVFDHHKTGRDQIMAYPVLIKLSLLILYKISEPIEETLCIVK